MGLRPPKNFRRKTAAPTIIIDSEKIRVVFGFHVKFLEKPNVPHKGRGFLMTTKKSKKFDTFYCYFIPVLLSIVACVQIFLAHQYSVSSWKMGGFGMFSKVDSVPKRGILGIAEDEQGKEFRILINQLTFTSEPALKNLILKTKCFPREKWMQQFGKVLLQYDYISTRNSCMYFHKG